MSKSGRIRFGAVLLALGLASISFGQTPAARNPGLSRDTVAKIRAFVEATIKQWHVAGAAVGIVKDGRIAFLEGFGRRDAAKNLPVTPKTKFILGSTTKAFVTTALGLLAAEKKVDWDAPIVSYLPEFRLMDEYASAHATVRDLAAHRTGLPRHDYVWVNSPMTWRSWSDPSASWNRAASCGLPSSTTISCLSPSADWSRRFPGCPGTLSSGSESLNP